MKCAVIVFPGSNCDQDMYHALNLLGHNAEYVWHKTSDLSAYDFVALPGGFSYGDYLRAGAIARFSNIMQALQAFAKKGKPILGVCNGFQILTEMGLLPGALLRNENLRFVCKNVNIRAESSGSYFTQEIPTNTILNVPIAHGEGRFIINPSDYQTLLENNQIAFRYVDSENQTTAEANPNGSFENIAGITNKSGNILGMMPHPERAVESLLGSIDGQSIFNALKN